MTIKNFILEICGIFLSISLSKTIENVIISFSPFVLISGILIFFLALNFFFAKFKQINDGEDNLSFMEFIFNILTLSCFAAMPFVINNFIGIMCIQLAMRFFDIILILVNNKGFKNIDSIEKRWIRFDYIYSIIIIGFLVLFFLMDTRINHLGLILICIYFTMGIFEALFDFIINRHEYGLTKRE